MVAGALQRSLQVLQDLNISVVVVGEIALNYYNVPCMLYVGSTTTFGLHSG